MCAQPEQNTRLWGKRAENKEGKKEEDPATTLMPRRGKSSSLQRVPKLFWETDIAETWVCTCLPVLLVVDPVLFAIFRCLSPEPHGLIVEARLLPLLTPLTLELLKLGLYIFSCTDIAFFQ